MLLASQHAGFATRVPKPIQPRAAVRRAVVMPVACMKVTLPRQNAVLQPAWKTNLSRMSSPRLRLRATTSRTRAVLVQANFFARIIRIVKAYVDSFVGSFEDPDALLNRVVEEMQGDIIKLRQASAQVMAAERQMNVKYQQAQANADEWVRRAELAVRKGEDDLAREALRRRKAFQDTADKLKSQLDLQKQAAQQLQANLRTLEGKLGEARNKKDTLKARAAAARSSKEIQEMVGGLRFNSSTAWAAFEKMEEKVVALEAEASTASMLSAPDSLEARFDALEGGSEDELLALKRSLATVNRPKAELPAGRPLREAFGPNVEYELEELRRKARS